MGDLTNEDTTSIDTKITSIEVTKKAAEIAELEVKPGWRKNITTKSTVETNEDQTPVESSTTDLLTVESKKPSAEEITAVLETKKDIEPTVAELPEEPTPIPETSEVSLKMKPVGKKPESVSKKITVERDLTNEDTTSIDTKITSIEVTKKAAEIAELEVKPGWRKNITTKSTVEIKEDQTPVESPTAESLTIESQKKSPEKTTFELEISKNHEPIVAELPEEPKTSSKISVATLKKKPVDKKSVSQTVSDEKDSQKEETT